MIWQPFVVDLQLLSARETLDLRVVRATCVRLFDYRRAHAWPAMVETGTDWATLYADASSGLDVEQDLDAAIPRVNDFIAQIDAASDQHRSAGETRAAPA